MNWISRLDSVVGKILTSMPCPSPTMLLSPNYNYEPAPATPVTPSLLPTLLDHNLTQVFHLPHHQKCFHKILIMNQ